MPARAPWWNGRGYVQVGRRAIVSPTFRPADYTPTTSTVLNRAERRRIGPGEVVYVPIGESPARCGVFIEFLHGSKGHFSFLPPVYLGTSPLLDQFGQSVASPRLLGGLAGTYELPGLATAPYWESGKWVNWGGTGVSAGVGRRHLSGEIVTADPDIYSGAGELIHCGGEVLKATFPSTGGGSGDNWEHAAFRLIWGPEAPQDFSGVHHFMAMVGVRLSGVGLTNRPVYATFELTSYPYLRGLPDDHAAVAGFGGDDDVAWRINATFDFPDPMWVFPGWMLPRSWEEASPVSEIWNTVDPPPDIWELMSPHSQSGHGIHWLCFPLARGLNSTLHEEKASIPIGTGRIDWSRITGMQIRLWYADYDAGTPGVGAEDGSSWAITPPYLTWNTFDGAMVDPVFGCDTYFPAWLYGQNAHISIANLGQSVDEVRYAIGLMGNAP